MQTILRIASGLLAVIAAAGQMPVQLPPANIAGTTLILSNGSPVSCAVSNPFLGAMNGQQIVFRFEPDPQDGRTIMGPTVPVPYIRINPMNLNQKPVPAQYYLVAHECGHVNSAPDMSEVTANCWAARRMRQLGTLSPAEWQVVYNVLLAAFPAPMGPYPSGSDQIKLMNPPYCS